jgi:hypothetical protein
VGHPTTGRVAPGQAQEAWTSPWSAKPRAVLANGYASVAFPVEDGMEISCRTGRVAEESAFGTGRPAFRLIGARIDQLQY